MKTRRGNILMNIDWISISIYLILILLGWLNIYAAVYDESHNSIIDMSMKYGKQLIWIITALILSFFVFLIDSKFYSAFAYIFYTLVMVSLLLVLFLGTEVNGSRSWFEIGNFRLQPSEFAKIATAFALAQFASHENFSLNKLRDLIGIAIIMGIPILLILLQNDTGSALIYATMIFVLYREGLNNTMFILFFILIALFILALIMNQVILLTLLILLSFFIFLFDAKRKLHAIIGLLIFVFISLVAIGIYYGGFWHYEIKYLAMLSSSIGILIIFIITRFIKIEKVLITILFLFLSSGFVSSVDYVYNNVLGAHQQNRIGELLGFKSDPLGAGYNVNQSKISIGSGGFSGKGFLQGTQTKYNFVPEQDTDFIFCTVGEEWGFLGSIVVVGLFGFLILRIIWLAERQRSSFSRIYGYCVASIFFFHIVINIGMTIGLAPVIGIPLPFFSYGGSSLWAFTILLMVFLRLDANRLEIFR